MECLKPDNVWRSAKVGDLVWRKYGMPRIDTVLKIKPITSGVVQTNLILLKECYWDYEGNVWPYDLK